MGTAFPDELNDTGGVEVEECGIEYLGPQLEGVDLYHMVLIGGVAARGD